MFKRMTIIISFTWLIVLGVVACGGSNSNNGAADTFTTIISPTPSSSPALSPTPSAALAPLHITGVVIGVSPSNISNIACGASTNLVFTATITSNSGNLGGQVPYTWSINHTNISGNVTFTPGQTTKTVAYTLSGVVIQLSSPSLRIPPRFQILPVARPSTSSIPPQLPSHLTAMPVPFNSCGVMETPIPRPVSPLRQQKQ